jgi:putative DNA methylase
MTAVVATKQESTPGLAPFSLKDAPSFIEAQFPVGRLSTEAYKERKAGAGQTLTALGSYWKGRKPLILVRAVPYYPQRMILQKTSKSSSN